MAEAGKLFFVRGGEARAHIWTGRDTMCGMLTEFAHVKSSWRVRGTAEGRAVCKVCAELEIRLAFDDARAGRKA